VHANSLLRHAPFCINAPGFAADPSCYVVKRFSQSPPPLAHVPTQKAKQHDRDRSDPQKPELGIDTYIPRYIVVCSRCVVGPGWAAALWYNRREELRPEDRADRRERYEDTAQVCENPHTAAVMHGLLVKDLTVAIRHQLRQIRIAEVPIRHLQGL